MSSAFHAITRSLTLAMEAFVWLWKRSFSNSFVGVGLAASPVRMLRTLWALPTVAHVSIVAMDGMSILPLDSALNKACGDCGRTP